LPPVLPPLPRHAFTSRWHARPLTPSRGTYDRTLASRWSRPLLPNLPLWDQGAAAGGAPVARLVGIARARPGSIPLAARGLAAVLARAGPAGADGLPPTQLIGGNAYIRVWRAGAARSPIDGPSPRPVIVHATPARSKPLRVAARWPAPLHHDETRPRQGSRSRSGLRPDALLQRARSYHPSARKSEARLPAEHRGVGVVLPEHPTVTPAWPPHSG